MSELKYQCNECRRPFHFGELKVTINRSYPCCSQECSRKFLAKTTKCLKCKMRMPSALKVNCCPRCFTLMGSH